jgi:hypothetical protein
MPWRVTVVLPARENGAVTLPQGIISGRLSFSAGVKNAYDFPGFPPHPATLLLGQSVPLLRCPANHRTLRLMTIWCWSCS